MEFQRHLISIGKTYYLERYGDRVKLQAKEWWEETKTYGVKPDDFVDLFKEFRRSAEDPFKLRAWSQACAIWAREHRGPVEVEPIAETNIVSPAYAVAACRFTRDWLRCKPHNLSPQQEETEMYRQMLAYMREQSVPECELNYLVSKVGHLDTATGSSNESSELETVAGESSPQE